MSAGTSRALARVNSDVGSIAVWTLGELDAELDRVGMSVSADRPAGISIERGNGDTLMAILGGPAGVLSFTGANGMPPYFLSLGDPSAEGVLAYWLTGDHHGEVPR